MGHRVGRRSPADLCSGHGCLRCRWSGGVAGREGEVRGDPRGTKEVERMIRVKIDDQVEPLVREAFGAAIARDSDRFSAALTAIASAGDMAANQAVNLALKVT